MLLGCAPALADDPGRLASQYHVTQWTTLDGLPADTVSHVLVLGDGRLLVSSYYGPPTLFDGVTFTTVRDEHGLPIAPNSAFSLEDREGNWWIGSLDAGLRLREPNGSTRAVALPGGPDNHPTCMLEATRSGLWVGTASGLVQIVDPSARTLGPTLELAGREIVSLLEDRQGRLWAGTDAGLFVRAADGWREPPDAGLSGVRIWALHESPDGRLWVGTRGRGMLAFDADGWRRFDAASGFPHHIVRRIAHSRDGTIWAATAGAGLVRLAGDRIEQLGWGEGLGSDSIWSVVVDTHDVLWVGTAGGGFARVQDSAFLNWTPAQGLASGFHWAVYEASDGSHYFGGNAGVSRLVDGRVESLGPAGPGDAGIVYALAEDAAGRLLVGTERGLFRRNQGRFERFPAEQPEQAVRVLFRDPQGTLWVGGRGLHRLEGDRLVAVDSPLLGADARIHRVGVAEGMFWVSTQRGLVVREAAGDRLRVAESEVGTVRGVWVDPDGRWWLAARGLWWLAGEATPRQLPAGPIGRLGMMHGLVADGHGALWAPNNRGLLRYAIDELMRYAAGQGPPPLPRRFDRRDGLVSSELNGGGQNAALRDRAGKLWFPAASGVTRLDPSGQRLQQTSIRAAITHLESGGQVYATGGTALLPAGTRRATIEYTALPAAEGPGAYFRYRLAPGEDGWVETGRERRTNLAGLAPGSYRFDVEAYLPDVPGAASSATQTFEVAPLPLERPWVRAALALAAGSLLLGLPAGHIRALRRQRAALLDEVADKTRALETLARTDALTGLANRRAFDEVVAQRWQRPGGQIGLVLIDIDHFKRFNDALGHPAGDACLRQVAEVIGRCRGRPEDMAARLGGEEFALLLVDAPDDAALRVGRRVQDALRAAALAHPASPLGAAVTASIGVSAGAPGEESPEQWFARADAALYAAKQAGRDRVELG